MELIVDNNVGRYAGVRLGEFISQVLETGEVPGYGPIATHDVDQITRDILEDLKDADGEFYLEAYGEALDFNFEMQDNEILYFIVGECGDIFIANEQETSEHYLCQ